ncbi:MAG: nuclear transport factor 2 family protein [Pseudomonadota bacterium]|nr:nuclear transport factor 2 family protein [Pseudomonadota bacterium]
MALSNSQETVIRELTARWVAAIASQQDDEVLSFYSDGIRSFDVILDQQVRGTEDYRVHLARCNAFCNGEPVFEMYDLEVTVEGSLAVAHGMIHCGCDDENGQLQTGWMRASFVWQQLDGHWQIVHEHLSNAFEPGSGELIMDWKPEHKPVPVPVMERAS